MIRKHTRLLRTPGKENGSVSKSKISFVASTAAVDRYGDVAVQNWELESYKDNPVVLFNHDQQSLPIGKGDVRIENEQLMIDVEFDMDDPTAAEIARKAKSGFLNAVSVGFQPLEFVPRNELPGDHEHKGDMGNLYTKSELLEVSIVTIPAQPEAVAVQRSAFSDFTDVLKDFQKSERRKNFLAGLKKHIIKVEETDEAYIVHFAKGEAVPDEVTEYLEDDDRDHDEDHEEMEMEEEEEDKDDKFLDDFIEASKDDEDYDKEKEEEENPEVEPDEEEEEEEEKPKGKSYNLALLRALTQSL